ncbi:MAG: hypothetical protein WC661_01885 [Opitutaceae bacterium]|jgi:hypothetical protein
MAGSSTIAALRQLLTAAKTSNWQEHDTVEMVLSHPIGFSPLRELSEAGVTVTLPDALQVAFDRHTTDTGEVGIDEKIKLKFSLTLEGFVAAQSLEDLLRLPEACTREPAVYALFGNKTADADFTYTAHIKGASLDSATDAIAGYHQTIDLWCLLEQRSDHIEEGTGALLFFGVRRTEIQSGFKLVDLPPRDTVKEIEAFVADEDRRATRLQIFKAELSDFLRDCSPRESFTHLLLGCDRFARRLREGLAIYLSEHSPQKLADEAKASALTLSEKLEKVISGLETKSLTIPVALILAVKDVSPGTGFTVLNLAIAAAALLFAVTMTFVHISQLTLLDVLRDTTSATRADYRRKGLEEKNPVLAIQFGGLETRCSRARVGSWIVCITSWTPLLLCVLAVWFWKPPLEHAPQSAETNRHTPTSAIAKPPTVTTAQHDEPSVFFHSAITFRDQALAPSPQ